MCVIGYEKKNGNYGRIVTQNVTPIHGELYFSTPQTPPGLELRIGGFDDDEDGRYKSIDNVDMVMTTCCNEWKVVEDRDKMRIRAMESVT